MRGSGKVASAAGGVMTVARPMVACGVVTSSYCVDSGLGSDSAERSRRVAPDLAHELSVQTASPGRETSTVVDVLQTPQPFAAD